MKFKTYTGITWSLLELRGILEDEDSRVYFERFKKHLGLHPFHLTNLHAALNEILSSNLNSYDPELKGFLLAYKNPKILTSLGEILYDTCFIHIDVEADFYIFRPEVGCTLKGIVNKKGLSHIGVLVHKAFNVSIPKPEGREEWVGDNVEIGQEIKFIITHLDFSSKLPFIRGALSEEDYLQGCRLMNTQQTDTCNTRISLDSSIQNNNDNESTTVTEKSIKQDKRHTFFNTDSESSSDGEIKHVVETTSKKKHAKKDKCIKEEDTVSDNELKKTNKKQTQKSKKVMKESTHKEVKVKSMQQLNNAYSDSDVEEYESKDTIVAKMHGTKTHNDVNSTDINVEHKHKKRNKDETKNASKKLSDTESKSDIVRVKLERFSMSNSDLENNLESNSSEKKKSPKKQSKKRAHVNDPDNEVTDGFVKSPSKRHSNVHGVSDSDHERTFVNVKAEHSQTINEDISPNFEATAELEETPYRKQLKKYKLAMKLDADLSEVESSSKNSPKKRSRKSSVHDPENSFENVTIKIEKTSDSEAVHINDKEKSNNTQKINSETSDVSFNSSQNVNEGEGKPPKKSKKHKKRQADEIKIETELDNIRIKVEKSDENLIGSTPKKSDSNAERQVNLSASNSANTLDGDRNDGAINLQNSAKPSKKPKIERVESKEHITNIKTEKSVANDSEERVSKKSTTDYDSDAKGKKQHNKSSPRKHSKKSKESEQEFDFRNVNVKIENTCSDS